MFGSFRLAQPAYWLAGVLAAALFLGSLLAHELSHGIVARREGLTVSGITFWLLGGIARMDGEAPTPGAEARIAGVGPLTSFGLALAAGGVAIALSLAPDGEMTSLAAASAAWLALVNLVLAIFNLLPGAPLDGGRIARSVIWRLRGDMRQATRWATGLGQLLGYGLVGLGLLRTFAGDLGGIWFALLGFFLSGAAAAERHSSELRETLRGLRVGDVMDRQPLRVPGGLTVETFATAADMERHDSMWLITGPGGLVVGVLSIDALRSVRGGDRSSRRIGELADPLERWPVAGEAELITDVLRRFDGGDVRAVVRDRDGAPEQVLGLLSPEGISRSIATRDATGGRDQERTTRGDDASADRILS